MLHFQVGLEQPQQHNDLQQRVLISCIVHVIIIVGICLYGTHSTSRIHITDTSDDYVVVMPLYKTIAQKPQKKTAGSQTAKKTQDQAQRQTIQASERHKSSKRTVVEKHQKSARIKPKVVESSAKPEKLREPEKQLYSARKRTQPQATAKPETKAEKPSVVAQEEQPTTIYLGRDDVAAYERGKAIKQALLEHWHAPHFVDIAGCELLIKIDKDGKKRELVILKSSGVPAYDTAARMAIMKTIFPTQVWGTEFTLVFGA